MGLGQLFQTEKVELYPEETKKMKFFLNNLKIQDYCFTKEISNDRIYEHFHFLYKFTHKIYVF